MKRCPICQRAYRDETLNFCRHDGTRLASDPSGESPTRIIGAAPGLTGGSAGPVTARTRPETNYARSGDVNIAYQVLGDGPIDLVYVPGWVSHIEYAWEQPLLARFFLQLASFSRLILFDKRGTGLSDQTSDLPTLEQRMDDVRAVMEAVGSERAALFGMSEGGNMAMLFDPIENGWGGPIGIEDLAPSLARDPEFREWWATYQRRSASPRAALALARMNTLIDVRHILPTIRVPALVMHRKNDRDVKVGEGRYVAAHIPGAKFVELPGEDHILYAGDQDAVLHDLVSGSGIEFRDRGLHSIAGATEGIAGEDAQPKGGEPTGEIRLFAVDRESCLRLKA